MAGWLLSVGDGRRDNSDDSRIIACSDAGYSFFYIINENGARRKKTEEENEPKTLFKKKK